jgi:orotidine-5'-phosphate decarboxylase
VTINPIFCAIDRPDLGGAEDLGRAVLPSIGGIKLGLEFVTANGPVGVRTIAALGAPIFLDLKLHDIPNTVAGAVRAVGPLEVRMLTLHASGGRAMLEAAVEAAGRLEPAERPWLLGVTVLTSLGGGDLEEIGVRGTVESQVLRLAELAISAGVDGLVCAPQEIRSLRARFGQDVRLVVPGIRPETTVDHDQRRTMAPAEAVALGADVLVIGRAITGARDPAAAAAVLARDVLAARAA